MTQQWKRLASLITLAMLSILLISSRTSLHAASEERVFLPMIVAPPASFVVQVVELTNQERANAGCPALTMDTKLGTAAQGHSDDMAANNFMSHTGSDGSSPWDRIRATGYSYSSAAENVAAGYSSPESVVNAWMGSSGHRVNILNCNLTEIGVGYAYSSSTSYGHYWTQVFATPR